MPAAERKARTERLAAISTRLPPAQWLSDQVAAID
jgi:hypothetical protein